MRWDGRLLYHEDVDHILIEPSIFNGLHIQHLLQSQQNRRSIVRCAVPHDGERPIIIASSSSSHHHHGDCPSAILDGGATPYLVIASFTLMLSHLRMEGCISSGVLQYVAGVTVIMPLLTCYHHTSPARSIVAARQYHSSIFILQSPTCLCFPFACWR